MVDTLINIDTQLFLFINQSIANPVFDWLMPFITKKEHGFPLWILVYILLLWKGGKKGITAAILVIPLITLSDQMSASFFKPFFERLRPCVVLENARLLTGMKTSFSFPSAHATNIFAAAMFFSVFYPKGIWFYFIFAFLVGLSRIYVGVHYPFDVFGGALLGILCALLVIFLYRFGVSIYSKLLNKKTKPVV